MNERIRELEKQAEVETEVFGDGFSGPYMVKRVSLEKFAELIVRECTNMLPNDSIRDENGVHMFYVIRKHFGVSEIGR